MLQYIKEFSPPLIVVIIGIGTWKFQTGFFKLLFFQAFLYLFTLVASYIVTPPHSTESNEWLYNLFFPVEFTLLFLTSGLYFKKGIYKMITIWLGLLFLGVWAGQLIVRGHEILANFAYSFGSIAMIILFTSVIFFESRKEGSVFANPYIWTSLGLSLYFACNLPFFALYPWMKSFPLESRVLYAVINDILAIARYLLLAYSFVLIYSTSSKKIAV